MNVQTWLLAARNPATVRRAGTTALIVGVILSAINHGPAILAGQLTHERIWQMLLTFLVPYTVSTVSSVATRLELRSARRPARTPASGLYGEPDVV